MIKLGENEKELKSWHYATFKNGKILASRKTEKNLVITDKRIVDETVVNGKLQATNEYALNKVSGVSTSYDEKRNWLMVIIGVCLWSLAFLMLMTEEIGMGIVFMMVSIVLVVLGILLKKRSVSVWLQLQASVPVGVISLALFSRKIKVLTVSVTEEAEELVADLGAIIADNSNMYN